MMIYTSSKWVIANKTIFPISINNPGIAIIYSGSSLIILDKKKKTFNCLIPLTELREITPESIPARQNHQYQH